MIRIGITGQSGFIGTHLYNTLGLYPAKYQRIPFEDIWFSKPARLQSFVKSCDVIVHLAAMNRHGDPQVIYNTNIDLVSKLINACEQTQSTPHILYSSSTQETRDNLYGKSKKLGREMFEAWADKNNGQFSGFVIPNVYGPFGNPYYNSVIATFCHQLTHGEQPKIDVDAEMNLIYVGELVKHFLDIIENVHSKHSDNVVIQQVNVSETTKGKVSQILNTLTKFRDQYMLSGEIPELSSKVYVNLFNTFVCYIDHANYFPFHLKLHTDYRGSFVETMKLHSGGQVSFSTTKPGITRGNHFHTRKFERFAVIKGKARIDLRRIGTDKVFTFELDGSKPSYVDMPIWYTHNITNAGDEELYTMFWISEHYDANDPDTYFEKV